MRRLLAVLPCLLALAAPAPAAAQADAPWWEDDDREQVQPPGEAPAWEDEAEEPAPAVEDDGWELPAPPPPVPSPAPAQAGPPLVTSATVRGRVARLRTDGRAAIPRGAPRRVRAVIAAANQIVGKPYVWGGGHARLVDRGYDCSGAVGYALIRAGLQRATMVSGTYLRWGAPGPGRWVSVYANKGHVYLEVAGLRLDTSPVADPSGRRGPRWRAVIGRRPGFGARHPAGL